jgi:hypothetical protein
MGERILIVNFDFPMNEGIGGRRWAKFAKQLASEGTIVHAIKAAPIKENKTSPWWTDVRSERIHIHTLPRPVPEFFTHPGNGIEQKILYRLYKKYLQLADGGTIYDQSIGWDKPLKNKIRELIETQGISKIYATGAPWNMLRCVAEVKEQYPTIQLLVDYRDPWITAMNYGMRGLSRKRFQQEKDDQLFIIERANAVTAPNDHLVREIYESDERLKDMWQKFHTLPHVIDPDDLEYEGEENYLDTKIRITYGGALYLGTERYLEQLVKACNSLYQEDKDLASQLSFEFFSPPSAQRKILENCPLIHVADPIGKELFSKMKSGNYSMILLAGHNKDFRTTKYYECLAMAKPLFFLGEHGEVSREIEENDIGLLFESANTLSALAKTERLFNYDFMRHESSKHHLREVTKTLRQILK